MMFPLWNFLKLDTVRSKSSLQAQLTLLHFTDYCFYKLKVCSSRWSKSTGASFQWCLLEYVSLYPFWLLMLFSCSGLSESLPVPMDCSIPGFPVLYCLLVSLPKLMCIELWCYPTIYSYKVVIHEEEFSSSFLCFAFFYWKTEITSA